MVRSRVLVPLPTLRVAAVIEKLPQGAPHVEFEFEVTEETELTVVVVLLRALVTVLTIVVVPPVLVVTPVTVESCMVEEYGMLAVEDVMPVVITLETDEIEVTVELRVKFCVVVLEDELLVFKGSIAMPRLIPMPKAMAIAENANVRLLYSDKE